MVLVCVAAALSASHAAPEPTDLTPNAQITETLREISPKNIEATVRKLVSFGTRHTLSDARTETRGIGAARRWIQSEFDIIGSSHAEDGTIDNKHVRLFAEGVPPLRQLTDSMRTTLQTGGENSPARELARFIKTTAEKHVSGMTVNIVYRRDRYLRGGDHSPFLDAGFPAVRLTEPNEDFRHQHQDLRERERRADG